MNKLPIIFFLIFSAQLSGQVYQMDGKLNLINGCEGFFTDSGGSSNTYENNENFTTTICPNPQEGTHIKLTFSRIDLIQGDRLCFYDGLNQEADSLVCVEHFHSGNPFIVQATAANNSGCLFVTFTSNNEEVGNGWEANLDCVPACQLINAIIDNTTPSAAQNGWLDICEGEEIFFNGEAEFPQNNLVYQHSESSSIFEWDFGDGVTAKGKNVSHVYSKAGGYQVKLTVTDQFECINGNFAFQNVRVALPPFFQIRDIPDVVCIGESFDLTGGVLGDNVRNTVETGTRSGSFLFNGIRSDSLALPDGNGASYKTSIRFSDFEAGQVLTDINDLFSICVNMEHSWLHDMEISISCPSGKTVLLQNQQVINKEVYLGQPIDNDGINPTSGRGAEYCWTPTSTNGTMTEFANNESDNPNSTFFLPANDYNSFQDLESLLGCPLNGDWTITVTDLWEQDNGWIFSWSIDINPALYPALESFKPEIIDFKWLENGKDVIDYSKEAITIQPSEAGTNFYTFEVQDNFGCIQDTSIEITVLPEGAQACLDCDDFLFLKDTLKICKGESLSLGSFVDPKVIGVQEFSSDPNIEFSNATNSASNAYRDSIFVSNVRVNTINEDGSNLVAVCIDLASQENSDLDITLISPNGIHLDLSSDNGSRNDGYLNTCFTLNANQAITEPTNAPFMGNYLPEEPFSKLEGSNINGNWVLQIVDDAGANDVNVLNSWSISFLSPYENAIYNWTPSENLDCETCLNPTANPAETTTYYLEKNQEGCIVTDSIYIEVLGNEFPGNVSAVSLEGGELFVHWEAIPNISAFEISLNGLDWIPTNGRLSHVYSGLSQNEELNIFLRGRHEELGCPTRFRTSSITYKFCDVQANLGSTQLITSCIDATDGFVVINTTGGDTNYRFSINGNSPQLNNRFDQLKAGNYQILIEDGDQCGDTLNFPVIDPPPIQLSFDIEHLKCAGDNIGAVTILPSGGVGGFEVIGWNHANITDLSVSNLSAGNYWVTVEDANNCRKIDTAVVETPDVLSASGSEKPISCYGAADGAATVKITGGTAPFTFNWEDGQVGESAVNLDTGSYRVAIIDANNCRVESEVRVTQPERIVINFVEEGISCYGEDDGALLAAVSGGIEPFEYRWSTLQTNQFTFGLKKDRYRLEVSDASGCVKDTFYVLEEPKPIVLSASSTAPLCRGEASGTATANVVGGTGLYEFDWSDLANQNTQTATNLPTGYYQVLATDENGCVGTTGIKVEKAEELQLNMDISPASCSNRGDGSVKIEAENFPDNYSILWNNGSTSDSLSELFPNDYYFTATYGKNCTLVDTITVEAPPLLTIDSINLLPPSCFGSMDGKLEAFISGGVQPYNYLWNTEAPSPNNIFSVGAGNHVLGLRDANGCSSVPQSINLSQPAAIQLVIDKEDVKCFGDASGKARVTVSGGLGSYSYQWDDNSNQRDSVAIELSAGIYIVTVTDENNCTTQSVITINEPLAPIKSQINQIDTACYKVDLNSLLITANGGTGIDYTYNWDNNQSGQTATLLSSGKHFVTITDEENCAVKDSFIVQQFDSILFSIIEAKPTCYNTSDGGMTLSPILGGKGKGIQDNYQIRWSTGPNQEQPFIDNLIGNTVYQVTVTDQFGCAQNQTRFLEAPPALKAALNKTDLSCFEANDGQITLTNFNGPSPINNYEWSANVAENENGIALKLSPDIYFLTLTDEDGCQLILSDTISEPLPLQIVQEEIFPNDCDNLSEGSIKIEVAGGTQPYQYNWSNGTSEKDLENVSEGAYIFSITDFNNCILNDTFNLIDPSQLQGTISTFPVSCIGDRDGRIDVEPTGGTPPYSFSLDGKNYNGIRNLIGLEAANYRIYIKDAKNCVWESSLVPLDEPEPFNVKIQTEQSILTLGDSAALNLQFSNNQGNVQYDWSANVDSTFICPQRLCSTIMITPTQSTTYEIYAVDAAGCEAKDILTIQVLHNQNVFVPTGFSPNGDGKNDFLLVHGPEDITVKSFQLFDRWGELVFFGKEMSVNNSKNTWDGTFKGKPLNTGVFVWLMEVESSNGDTKLLKGSTTLIR